MILGDLQELKIHGVYDRGVPNKERIVITVEETVDMGQFGLMLGARTQNAMAMPIADNMFWFGDGIVQKGDILFLYTGPGQATKDLIPNSLSSFYSLHWGRKNTVLANPAIVPILFRIDAVHIPFDPPDVPQYMPTMPNKAVEGTVDPRTARQSPHR